MRAWSSPEVPTLAERGPEVRIFDTQARAVVPTEPNGDARLYVCGITPYDATHMGHASTYVAFDLLNRAWRNAGHTVTYAQNVTDVDDPLLERAAATNVDWRDLAEREIALFREDMEALRVLAPDTYTGVVEAIVDIVDLISVLDAAGSIYRVPVEDGSGEDLYFAVASDADFGSESRMTRAEMLEIFPQRGGDPDRAGKLDPLDALVWRAERPGEPSWPSPFGHGRPGWHIECAAIAVDKLGAGFTVQGGGSDLVFPHHEMSAAHSHVAVPGIPFAQHYVHGGMVGYEGEKMSKSKGNLVLVSRLRRDGVDPMAVRLMLLQHHYRSDWEWTHEELDQAIATVAQLRSALAATSGAPAKPVVVGVLEALADDLDAPKALGIVTAWASETLAGDGSDAAAPAEVAAVLDAALGLRL